MRDLHKPQEIESSLVVLDDTQSVNRKCPLDTLIAVHVRCAATVCQMFTVSQSLHKNACYRLSVCSASVFGIWMSEVFTRQVILS